jgi:hypothetical protein
MLYGEIGIDLFAGPTEVLIVADEDASPFMCAVDLLSQAEHGPDTPAVLVTNSERVGKETIEHVEKILTTTNMSTAGLASTSWKAFGEVVVTESIDEAYKVADTYASEHVQILTKSPRDALTKMSNYGALFLGAKTCVSYGDKVSGDFLEWTFHDAARSKANDYAPCNDTTCSRSSEPTMSCLLKEPLGIREDFAFKSSSRRTPTRKSRPKKPRGLWADSAAGPLERKTLKDTPDRVIFELRCLPKIRSIGSILENEFLVVAWHSTPSLLPDDHY